MKENPKRFWSYFRSKTKSNSIPASVNYDGRTLPSAVDKAEAFNKFFYSSFTQDPDDAPASFVPPDPRVPLLDSIQVSEKEVHLALSNLDPARPQGPMVYQR